MSIVNFLKGEEPGFLRKVAAALKEDTGGYGEYLTEYALEHGKLPGKRAVFRNVLVPRSTGPTSTSEIDVLLLHETGVYVVESKNYSGWIFGSAEQRQWTQSLKGGHKERFYNPILQNRSHVKALAAHLGLTEDVFRSYIVFSERCELKKVPLDDGGCRVCKRNQLMGKLRKDIASRTRVLWDEQFDVLEAELAKLVKASTSAEKASHVEEVERVQQGLVCPRCGGELVKRSGRYGEFYGCSNYPKCRFTKHV